LTGEAEPLERLLADLARRLQVLEARPDASVVTGESEEPRGRSVQPGRKSSSTALGAIDAQIAVSSPRDAYLWIQARGEVVRQDEFVRDRAHLRTVEKVGVIARVGLSALAIGGGIGLAFAGFGLPAFVCLGAGLYGLAPNFIDAVTKRVLGQDPGDHG
jgi:hypothetical protein